MFSSNGVNGPESKTKHVSLIVPDDSTGSTSENTVWSSSAGGVTGVKSAIDDCIWFCLMGFLLLCLPELGPVCQRRRSCVREAGQTSFLWVNHQAPSQLTHRHHLFLHPSTDSKGMRHRSLPVGSPVTVVEVWKKHICVGLQTDCNIAAGCVCKPCWVFPSAMPRHTSHANNTGFSLHHFTASTAVVTRH